MKILIKSEDAKKLTNLSEQMDVTDSGVELGKDLNVDGKIVVNSADDVVDINGQPIAGGGGGSEFYIHHGYVQDDSFNTYSFKLLSRVSTAYTDFYDLHYDDTKLFQLRADPTNTIADVSVESGKSDDYFVVSTVDGEYHEFETIRMFEDHII